MICGFGLFSVCCYIVFVGVCVVILVVSRCNVWWLLASVVYWLHGCFFGGC